MIALLSPEGGFSPNADDLNALYWVMVVLAGILLIAVNAALIGVIGRFRAARGREPRRLTVRRPAQVMIASVLAAIAAMVFILSVIVTENAKEVEASGPDGLQAASVRTAQRTLDIPSGETAPLEVRACGQQWLWRYEYPDGTYSYYELVVPVDTAVIVNLCSTDVVHRWSVPGLGGKFDAVPGESNKTWFKADRTGEFDGQSYAFSGAGYAVMRTRVTVVEVPEYQAWLDQQAAGIQEAQAFVQERNAQ